MDDQVWQRLSEEARFLAHRTPNAVLELDRLHYAFRFGPTSIYVGQFEFEGKFALLFPNADRVLIDVPFVGRAAYLYGPMPSPVTGGAQDLASVQGLKEIARICHIGDWKLRLKHLLGLKLIRTSKGRLKAPRKRSS